MPATMATSATLKIPVRIGPTPTLRKSITIPMVIRSTRFEIPPATNISRPAAANLDHLYLAVTIKVANRKAPFAI